MRVAFVIPSMLRGGAERVVSILCNEFVNRGNDVFLYLTEIVDNIGYPLDIKVKIVNLTVDKKAYIRRVPVYINMLKKQTKKDKIDIVVSFLTRTNFCSIIACKQVGIPVVVSERNNPFLVPANRHLRRLRDFVYKYTDGIVFQTSCARDYYGLSVIDKSVIIMNPIATFKKELRPIKDRENIIITACRLVPQKNIFLLIKAFSQIADSVPEFKLHIYGDGPLKNDLKDLIEKLNLENRIFLKGVDQNVIEKVANAKIFALSSDFEGLSNSLAEALSVGTACIATDSPTFGNRDLIIDGKSGYLVPVGDVDFFANKLREMTTDTKLLEGFSLEGSKLKLKVDTQVIVDRWYNYMNQVINRISKENSTIFT